MAALPLGIARTAIDALVEIAAGGKQPAGAGAPLAERTTVQADVARAEALYLSGRSFLYDSVTQSWEAVKAGRELSVCEPLSPPTEGARFVLTDAEIVS